MVIGTFNTMNDFMLLALPMPMVWKLQLPIKQRIAVISILSISFLACIAGIIRVAYSNSYVRSYDQPWDAYNMGLAAGVELNLGVVGSISCLDLASTLQLNILIMNDCFRFAHLRLHFDRSLPATFPKPSNTAADQNPGLRVSEWIPQIMNRVS